MDIEKELEGILDDPLLDLSEEEAKLFDIPQDMRKAMTKKKADYIAQTVDSCIGPPCNPEPGLLQVIYVVKLAQMVNQLLLNSP